MRRAPVESTLGACRFLIIAVAVVALDHFVTQGSRWQDGVFDPSPDPRMVPPAWGSSASAAMLVREAIGVAAAASPQHVRQVVRARISELEHWAAEVCVFPYANVVRRTTSDAQRLASRKND